MSKAVNISVDFNKESGAIKAMHALGQPPITGLSNTFFHYFKEAGIPYSRLHDVGGWLGGGLYVDIPNLFRDFDADENDPASYDFAFTDKILEGLVENGCEPYFRLGVSIENQHMIKTYRLYPPKDFGKWARICEHVVRHYNEGWANGYRMGIAYWEIWNEPDDCFTNEMAAMWKGTPEEFFELYAVTATHLKACFGDTIKVGGYGHCGLYEYQQDKNLIGIEHEVTCIYEFVIEFMHGFLRYQRERNVPIDFFSWHVYDNCHESTKEDFLPIFEHAAYIRRVLDSYGYTNTEHHLNEWNLWTNARKRDYPIAAAKSLAFMLMMQKSSTEIMCYYDGKLGFSNYGAIINPDSGYPYRTYYAIAMFNALYRLKNEVEASSDDAHVFVCAAKSGRKASIVISNINNEDMTLNLNVLGFNTECAQVLRIDEENRYTLTGEDISSGEIRLPANSCVEIKLFDLS